MATSQVIKRQSSLGNTKNEDMATTEFIIHRADLGVPSVDISESEFVRCTDIIEIEMLKAGIDWQTAEYNFDRWVFLIRESDRDPVSEIVGKTIEGWFGKWTDAANDA